MITLWNCPWRSPRKCSLSWFLIWVPPSSCWSILLRALWVIRFWQLVLHFSWINFRKKIPWLITSSCLCFFHIILLFWSSLREELHHQRLDFRNLRCWSAWPQFSSCLSSSSVFILMALRLQPCRSQFSSITSWQHSVLIRWKSH